MSIHYNMDGCLHYNMDVLSFLSFIGNDRPRIKFVGAPHINYHLLPLLSSFHEYQFVEALGKTPCLK